MRIDFRKAFNASLEVERECLSDLWSDIDHRNQIELRRIRGKVATAFWRGGSICKGKRREYGLMRKWLWHRLNRVAGGREPDREIGSGTDVYLRRWFVIPRNPIFNIYLHNFRRSDDARALHDHPWFSMTLILSGHYREHRKTWSRIYNEGSVIFRSPWTAHRIELFPMTNRSVWTLFITGPRLRKWGFHCPEGWKYWKDFQSDDGC